VASRVVRWRVLVDWQIPLWALLWDEYLVRSRKWVTVTDEVAEGGAASTVTSGNFSKDMLEVTEDGRGRSSGGETGEW
jgi:hypothetical protein